MNRIAIDMSPIVHGSRAISHCTSSIAEELITYKDIEFKLLYFDCGGKSDPDSLQAVDPSLAKVVISPSGNDHSRL